MKASLKKFIEYVDSDEELFCFIRINAEWNEESFIKMEKLVREVMDDYSMDNFCHKGYAYYCIEIIRLIIGTISHDMFCNTWPDSYTQESYRIFIAERVRRLEKLQKDFIASL
ncbi:hypothetical protein [Anaerocolumna jejuensis]|uniref:hypothetical protein n=1 Tax=Anaerocolumna jejuensis TaxID=259063 RepID=UPI003F7C7DC9